MTAPYSYEKQRQHVKKTHPSKWAIVVALAAVVVAAVVWAVAGAVGGG